MTLFVCVPALIFAVLGFLSIPLIEEFTGTASAVTGEKKPTTPGETIAAKEKEPVHPRKGDKLVLEDRIDWIEKTLRLMQVTGQKAESRSRENKGMARELVRIARVMVVVLVIIAAGFPLSLWLLSRKRLIGLSGLSSELAATLLVVEERQAKLVNIFKDLQDEIDFLDSMSTPDLKKLIEQAEKYLEHNQNDLAMTREPESRDKVESD